MVSPNLLANHSTLICASLGRLPFQRHENDLFYLKCSRLALLFQTQWQLDFGCDSKSGLSGNLTMTTCSKSGHVQILDVDCKLFLFQIVTVNVQKPNVRFSDSAEIRTIDRSVIYRSDSGSFGSFFVFGSKLDQTRPFYI